MLDVIINNRAKIVVIDGCDGSGKETQTKLLKAHFEKAGRRVLLLSFPNYSSNSSDMCQLLLKGMIQCGKSIHKDMIFALDRAITMYEPSVKEYLEDENAIVICDRYVASNIIYSTVNIEGAYKFKTKVREMEHLEYNVMKIPRPDVNILLNINYDDIATVLQTRINDNIETDINEQNIELMKAVSKNIDRFNSIPTYSVIDCYNKNKERMSVEETNNEIIRILNIRNIK